MFISLGLPLAGFASEDGIDPATGLKVAEGWEQVRAQCGGCHSLDLVRQNRGDAGHWLKLIRWMQAEHRLWDLGPAEATIVDYLAANYGAPEIIPRRQPLQTTWRHEERP